MATPPSDTQISSPTKRRKLTSSHNVDDTPAVYHHTSLNNTVEQLLPLNNNRKQNRRSTMSPHQPIEMQRQKELEVGIVYYVDKLSPGYSGILKQRYTDFLVNEILPSGEVLHLRSIKIEKRKEAYPPIENDTKTENTKPKTVTASEDAIREQHIASATAAWNELPAKLLKQYADDRKQRAEDFEKRAASIPNFPKLDRKSTFSEIIETTEKSIAVAQGSENDQASATKFQLSTEDEALLLTFFTPETLRAILDLYKRILASKNQKREAFGKVKSDLALQREVRTQLHHAIRRIFAFRLETYTGADGKIIVSAAGGSSPNKRGPTSPVGTPYSDIDRRHMFVKNERRGPYLHFTLYKENKDTMEVTTFLARQTKLDSKAFQFAGTKDRRAVTVQRVSVFRGEANKFASMNKSLRGAKVGDFQYEKVGLSLGELAGNEFVITLRDCKFPGTEGMNIEDQVSAGRRIVASSVESMEKYGFINYFGMQRFGSFSTGTHEIGMQMLKGNFKRACDQILYFSKESLMAAQSDMSELPCEPFISVDDQARAMAINIFRKTGTGQEALARLPRKFSAEVALIQHLSSNGKSNDWQGALQRIHRNLRLMYVHAYQSLVWNVVAGERYNRWGSAVVEGDLVLVADHGEEIQEATDMKMEIDDDGEIVILPLSKNNGGDDIFERARPLSKVEAESGKYTIFDVVLPTPGFDIVYPANSMFNFYKEFMVSDRGGNLDPLDMRRTWKDVSLSGSYRKLMAQAKGINFDVKIYHDDTEQMVATDLDIVQGTQGNARYILEDSCLNSFSSDSGLEVRDPTNPVKSFGSDDSEGGVDIRKLAIIMKFQLASSQYATVALREMMKDGGVKVYKPDFGGGR